MSDLGNKEIMAKNIKRYMNELNIERKDLATSIGVAYTTLSDWVNAKKYPRIDKIEAMANLFGVLKSDLVEESSTKQILPSNLLKIERNTRKIPIISSIPAGNPKPLEEDFEGYINIDSSIQGDFVLKVKGNSMIDANILEGDLAIIKRDCNIYNGEIYAVSVNDEATLKKLYKEKDCYILQPCNSEYQPIIIKEDDNPYIVGKLTAIIREY